MEDLFASLAVKCLENNLRFEYIPASTGLIVSDHRYNRIGSIWMDAEDVSDELRWLHRQVDNYLKGAINNERITSAI